MLLALFFFSALAGAAETTAPWNAELSTELSAEVSRGESGSRPLNYLFNLNPSWRLSENWKVGAESELEIAKDAKGSPWRDTSLQLARSIPLNDSIGLTAKAFTILPTDRAEQEAGLYTAPGFAAEMEYTPNETLQLSYEIHAARFLRNSEKSEAAMESDKWRAEQAFVISLRLLRALRFETEWSQGRNWRPLGREDSLGQEYRLSYEHKKWRVVAGHRSNSVLRAMDGTRGQLAFFRAPESQVFSALVLSL